MKNLKRYLKIILLIVMMTYLISCQKVISNSCPDLVHYTIEEQRELEKTLKEVDKAIINKYIIDYGNLRDKIRICND